MGAPVEANTSGLDRDTTVRNRDTIGATFEDSRADGRVRREASEAPAPPPANSALARAGIQRDTTHACCGRPGPPALGLARADILTQGLQPEARQASSANVRQSAAWSAEVVAQPLPIDVIYACGAIICCTPALANDRPRRAPCFRAASAATSSRCWPQANAWLSLSFIAAPGCCAH